MPIKMKAWIYPRIAETVGCHPPETGGYLGTSAGPGWINAFRYVPADRFHPNAYIPDEKSYYKVMKEWQESNIQLVGLVHSHPGTDRDHKLSSADIGSAVQLLQHYASLTRVFMFIVQSIWDNKKFEMYTYAVSLVDGKPEVASVRVELG